MSLLSDHSGRRLVLLVAGLALASLAYASMLVVETLTVLVVLSFIAGVGNSVYHPCGTALTAERFPLVKPYAISVHGMMGNIGASLMPIGLAAAAAAFGWRTGLALCTLPMVLLLPAIAARFRSVEPADRPPREGRSFARNSLAIATMVFRERNVVLLAVVYALSGMATKASVGFIPLLAERRFDLRTPEIGLLLSLFFGMGIAAKPVMAWVYSKMGPRSALLLPMLVSSGATLAIAVAPWPAVFVVMIGLVGATSPISPVILTATADYSDPRVLASSVGLIYSLHAIGFVAPAIAGLLAECCGLAYAYVFSAGLFLAGAAVTLLLRHPK
jgi:MFS family permease